MSFRGYQLQNPYHRVPGPPQRGTYQPYFSVRPEKQVSILKDTHLFMPLLVPHLHPVTRDLPH